MSISVDPTTPVTTRKLAGLGVNTFAVLVMLIIEFCLGMITNLFANIPATDKGANSLAAFGKAVTNGPVVLTLHALLGTLIVIGAITVMVRAFMVRRASSIVLSIIGLFAILMAWMSGTRFIGDNSNGTSLSMAFATAIAMFCYATLLFVARNKHHASRNV